MIQVYSFLGFSLSGNDVRNIVFSFAEANGFEGFSKIHNEAGRKWFGFILKRYPQLKVKETVTNLSIAQANATRKSLVLAWYKYENVLKQLEITDPNQIHLEPLRTWFRRYAKNEEGHRSQGHKTVSETTSREVKVDHDADLCQCCKFCIASPGNPQRQIP